MTTKLTAPAGTSGLAIEPWTPGEIYAVAARWSQAAAPVWCYGQEGWQPTGKQVADFSHEPKAALWWELYDSLIASGEEPDDATKEADNLIDDAEDLEEVE